MIEIVMVRHGQPDWEPGGRARDEPELTPLGRRQARCVAEALADEHFDAIYSSPLLRAVETMEPIAKRLGMQPRVEDWLAEIRLPTLEGVPLDQVEAFFARARARTIPEWWDGMGHGGESFRHFHERVVAGVEELLLGRHRAQIHEEHAHRLWRVPEGDQKLLLVAHGGTIGVLVHHLLGTDPVPWAHERYPVGWAGITRLDMQPISSGAVWSLRAHNRRDHLLGLPDPAG